MSDLISRAEAIRIASGYCHPANIVKELEKLPSAQPEIIRCKYCKHWCLPPCPCVFVDGDFKWINFMEDDGWCSKGELRGDSDGREKI